MKFTDQRALVTGGTKGIGKATARRLARSGAHVILNYAASETAAMETLKEFKSEGFSAELVRADVGNPDQITTLLERILDEGPLDMLICNAAFSMKVPFLDTQYEQFQRTLEVNVLGNFHLIQTVARHMTASHVAGRIVACTSPHGTLIFPDAFAYDVSKAALNHLIRCTALPLIEDGIRVNGVDIGWTVTPGERRFTTEEEQYAVAREIVPIRRPAEADEIAAVIEFLCSDGSSYMVGSILRADGGYCLSPSNQS